MSSRLPSFGILDWPFRDLEQVTSFADLVDANPFIYRVHSDHSHAPLTPRGFVASVFKNKTHLPDLSSIKPSFECVVNRISGQNLPSPTVSASFSFTWAVFEAFRRSLSDEEEGVAIAVIRAVGVADHAMTALEALNSVKPVNGKFPPEDEWERLVRLANAQSEVLVNGQIPSHCIEAVIPASDLLCILPSYYKRDGKPIFRYEKGSWARSRTPQIQLASEALASAFGKSMRKCGVEEEVAARRKAGIGLAMDILGLQQGVPDPSTDPGYEPFVARASRLAFELAHFPCARCHLPVLVSHLQYTDVEEEMRKGLHQSAIDEAMRALRNDTRFRRGRTIEDVGEDLATAMSSLGLTNPVSGGE